MTVDPAPKRQKKMTIFSDHDPKGEELTAPYIKLFSSATTNGRKVTIFLELLKINYSFRNVKDFFKETKEPWFLENVNPVGKIPVLIDVNEAGDAFKLTESGAILSYLAHKYDTEHKFSYSINDPRHWEETEFLFFHASNLGVSQTKFNQTKSEEAKELLLKNYGFVENKLKANNGWLVGDHFSLADAIALAHVDQFYKNVDDESTKHLVELKKWYNRLINLQEVKAAFAKTD